MVKYEKIIFVGTENTCKSPMAEAIYKSLETNIEIETISRGTVVLFPEPFNPKADLVLNNHHLSIAGHVAKQLTKEDVDENTLLLTMKEKEKVSVIDLLETDDNVYLIKEFIGEAGDVLDPYGGTLVDYEQCYIELSRIIKKTVYKLNEEV